MILSPIRNPIQNPIPTEGGAVATYAEVLRDTYGASALYNLVDITSGTVIHAFINSARDGALVGWDLQNTAGPVTGTLAPYSDGVIDRGNIYTSNGSTGLADIFNGTTGSVFQFLKVKDAPIWENGVIGYSLYIRVNSGTFIFLQKDDTNNQFIAIYRAAGNNKEMQISMSDTGWFSIGLSWDKTAAGGSGELKVFKNGIQSGSTVGALGVWSGSPTRAGLLGRGDVASFPWNGYGAYSAFKFGSVWSPADFLAMHNAAATAGPD